MTFPRGTLIPRDAALQASCHMKETTTGEAIKVARVYPWPLPNHSSILLKQSLGLPVLTCEKQDKGVNGNSSDHFQHLLTL